MHRAIVALSLVLALLSQSLAGPLPPGMADREHDHDHASLHWMQIAHVHHDDGTYNEDDSFDANWHVMADAQHSAPALPPGHLAEFGRLAAGAPPTGNERLAAPPFLDGPRRPPRTPA